MILNALSDATPPGAPPAWLQDENRGSNTRRCLIGTKRPPPLPELKRGVNEGSELVCRPDLSSFPSNEVSRLSHDLHTNPTQQSCAALYSTHASRSLSISSRCREFPQIENSENMYTMRRLDDKSSRSLLACMWMFLVQTRLKLACLCGHEESSINVYSAPR